MHKLNDFESCDTINASVIHAHHLMNQMGSLMAVKSYKAMDVFEGLGGFKNMYPLVNYIVKSNLKESYGATLPG